MFLRILAPLTAHDYCLFLETPVQGQKEAQEEGTEKKTATHGKETSRYLYCTVHNALAIYISYCYPFHIALLAMKGMMVQDGLTMDDALKLMEEGQKTPNRPAPKLPPKLLGMLVSLNHLLLQLTLQCSAFYLSFVFSSGQHCFFFFFFSFFFFFFPAVVSSSSSDTDKHDFNYDTSSESLEVRSCNCLNVINICDLVLCNSIHNSEFPGSLQEAKACPSPRNGHSQRQQHRC